MSGFRVACENSTFAVVSFLDVNILVMTESLPEPQIMNIDWLRAQLKDALTIDDIDIVLIGDSRSFYFANLLVNCDDFHGVILCTHPVYRLGRLMLREISTLRTNKATPVPTSLSIVPLRILEVFPFGEIAIIPHANGCGLGNCNWLLTKGVDLELVSFSAFIITGYCAEPLVFPRPTPRQIQPTVVCVLPSAVQEASYHQILEDLVRRIDGCTRSRRSVIIPTFIDDVLYSILFFMRIGKSMNTDFYVASFYFDSLVDILSSMPNERDFIPIQNLSLIDLSKPDFPERQGIFFAPYPVGQPEFGQIIRLKQHNFPRGSTILPLYGEGSLHFTHNTNALALARYVDSLKADAVFAPRNCPVDSRKDYPCDVPVSDSIIRWIDWSKVPQYRGKIGELDIMAGYLEGERAVPFPLFGECILNAPDMEEVVMQLREQGATSITRNGNTITVRFAFISGDCEASITFGDTITIEAGRPEIEATVQKCIGIDY